MTAYADYAYYTDTFLGNSITETDFPPLAMRASAVIDQLTYGRAAPVVEAGTDTATITAIQLATCAVAEELLEQSAGGQVQSERVGQHSVTYVAGPVISQVQRQAQAAKVYLATTGLMYRGFNEDEL